MIIVDDIRQRLAIGFNGSLPWGRRILALLEAILMPTSFVTILALAALPVVRRCGVEVPQWTQGPLVTVFVSAAIGYLTNWVAIEMLFKPYRPTLRHPFSVLTLGFWRQGLVPKNKAEVAAVLGEQVATRLLQPEKIADDLCSMVGGVLRNERVVSSIRDSLMRFVAAHDQEIASFLAPKIEEALVREIDRLVTVEKVEAFWTAHIERKLRSPETRDEIASVIIAALEARAPALAQKAKPLIVSAITDYVEQAGGFFGSMAAPFVEAIADYIVSRKTLENGLRAWLRSPDAAPALRDELLHLVSSVRDYLKSGESQAKIGSFVEEIRATFKAYLHGYVKENLVAVAGKLLDSESLWNGVVEMIPKFQPEIERLVRSEGIPLIMEKLNFQGRVRSAVDKMDVEEFHGMVNEIAAQHLGAIQVLGYLLGALAGGLMLIR